MKDVDQFDADRWDIALCQPERVVGDIFTFGGEGTWMILSLEDGVQDWKRRNETHKDN
jgi:hypothetical protein